MKRLPNTHSYMTTCHELRLHYTKYRVLCGWDCEIGRDKPNPKLPISVEIQCGSSWALTAPNYSWMRFAVSPWHYAYSAPLPVVQGLRLQSQSIVAAHAVARIWAPVPVPDRHCVCVFAPAENKGYDSRELLVPNATIAKG
jgi:hypothetical protein